VWLKVALPRTVEWPWALHAEQRRGTLLDFLDDVYASPKEFLVFDDGYRTWSYTYEQVRGAAYTFRCATSAARAGLHELGKASRRSRPRTVADTCTASSRAADPSPAYLLLPSTSQCLSTMKRRYGPGRMAFDAYCCHTTTQDVSSAL
jgi:hypothetical protein